MSQHINIRPAVPDDGDLLTKIAFASKSYWNYPSYYLSLWEKELTITPRYIHENHVFVAESDAEAVGFYSLVSVAETLYVGSIGIEKGLWLDHMFVSPEKIGTGIGTVLMRHVTDFLRSIGVKRVSIFVDPNAEGFYKKMGAVFRRYSDSSIPGRQIPVYEYECASCG